MLQKDNEAKNNKVSNNVKIGEQQRSHQSLIDPGTVPVLRNSKIVREKQGKPER